MSIAAWQRYTRDHRCPICGGCAYDPRGQGRRCIGFLSSDRKHGRCSREEHAGALRLEDTTGTFVHLVAVGRCRCGLEHLTAAPSFGRNTTTTATSSPRIPGRPMMTLPAPCLPPVAVWLERERGICAAEIGNMRAVTTNAGPAVAFPYLRPDSSVLAVKVRPIDCKDRMFRSPAGAGALPLYRAEHLSEAATDTAKIVEGELDTHVLHSEGVEAVVSVPDGAKTRITPALIAPLARFTRVLVAVDADPEGDALARRLALALGPARCRRLTFGRHKDANDALRAGWRREDFEHALSSAGVEAA